MTEDKRKRNVEKGEERIGDCFKRDETNRESKERERRGDPSCALPTIKKTKSYLRRQTNSIHKTTISFHPQNVTIQRNKRPTVRTMTMTQRKNQRPLPCQYTTNNHRETNAARRSEAKRRFARRQTRHGSRSHGALRPSPQHREQCRLSYQTGVSPRRCSSLITGRPSRLTLAEAPRPQQKP